MSSCPTSRERSCAAWSTMRGSRSRRPRRGPGYPTQMLKLSIKLLSEKVARIRGMQKCRGSKCVPGLSTFQAGLFKNINAIRKFTRDLFILRTFMGVRHPNSFHIIGLPKQCQVNFTTSKWCQMLSCLIYSWIHLLPPYRCSQLSHKIYINLELIYCHQKYSRQQPRRYSHLALHLQAFHIK